MSSKGSMSTTAIVLVIVALVIGAGIGIGVYPSLFPIKGVVITQEEYDGYQQLSDDYEELYADYQQLNASLLSGEIKLGFLGSMTGRLASFGENELTAAEFAADQINALLADAGQDWTIKIVVEDTQTDPATCLEKVELFNSQGITLLIGPLSSAEVLQIKSYCDSNKLLAISQSSTVPSLAIEDDYIFRFAPTDIVQGKAIARMIWDDGKEYVISVCVQDPWGLELRDTTKASYIGLGGNWSYEIEYAPTVTEFSSEADILATQVQNAVTAYGAENVAVHIIGFEEVATFFTAASAYPVLSTVKWYGSDGTALSGAILDDPTAADFAVTTEFPNTIFSPTQTWKWEAVRDNNLAELGREPDSYSYAVYDVVWAYALSLMAVDTYDAEAVKEVLPTIAPSMFGALGWIDLDEHGDIVAQNYNIWEIEETAPGVYGWTLAGVYYKGTDTILWE